MTTATRHEVPTIDHPTGRENFTRVTTQGVSYWFSYRTCVAFNLHDGRGPIVRENEWGPTTGKHLNYIDDGDKASRVSGEVFALLVRDLNTGG